jgi:hypothetical protein
MIVKQLSITKMIKFVLCLKKCVLLVILSHLQMIPKVSFVIEKATVVFFSLSAYWIHFCFSSYHSMFIHFGSQSTKRRDYFRGWYVLNMYSQALFYSTKPILIREQGTITNVNDDRSWLQEIFRSLIVSLFVLLIYLARVVQSLLYLKDKENLWSIFTKKITCFRWVLVNLNFKHDSSKKLYTFIKHFNPTIYCLYLDNSKNKYIILLTELPVGTSSKTHKSRATYVYGKNLI